MRKVISLILALFSLVGCSSNIKMDKSIDIENIEINQDIVFIYQYTNWAWEYQNYGSFIDKNGKSYKFDFSEEPEDMSYEEMLDNMTEIMENDNTSTGYYFNNEDMKYLYALLYKVDENSGFDEECVACDAGQRTLYGVRYNKDGSAEKIQIYSDGDWLRKPNDKNAQKLYNYYISVITAENYKTY